MSAAMRFVVQNMTIATPAADGEVADHGPRPNLALEMAEEGPIRRGGHKQGATRPLTEPLPESELVEDVKGHLWAFFAGVLWGAGFGVAVADAAGVFDDSHTAHKSQKY